MISHIAGTLLTLAAIAVDPPPCPEKHRGTLEEWQCFGELEFATQFEGRPDFGARFVLFDGRERLYEKREAGGVKVMLRGDGYLLYRGLGAADSTVIGAFNPFLFFEFALILPTIALVASDAAPSALPPGVTPVRYADEGRGMALMREVGVRTVDGSIERTGAEYAFRARIKTTEVPVSSISGRWSSARVAPWPDSMLLEGWQYGCPRASSVDVRGNHRPVPAGVTLGDVRRGWQGPCN